MNNKFSYLICVAIVTGLASCLNTYNIEGSTDHPGLDNSKVYLRIVMNDSLRDMDSTEVVHGKFGLSGTTDSTRVVRLVFDNFSIPLVLEEGLISVKVNKSNMKWGGTALNDKLYHFFSCRDSLSIKLEELDHEYYLAFMDGKDMQNDVIPRLSKENQLIIASMDSLFTQSVVENFDNVLGPFIFMTYAQMRQFPEMTPWVVDIMSKVTDNFKKDPFVVNYINKAKQIQNQANGLEQPAPVTLPQPPTPNEMAAPAVKEAGDTSKVKKDKK